MKNKISSPFIHIGSGVKLCAAAGVSIYDIAVERERKYLESGTLNDIISCSPFFALFIYYAEHRCNTTHACTRLLYFYIVMANHMFLQLSHI